MTETAKTRAGAATPTRAVENGTASQTSHASTKDSIILAADSQTFRVAALLHPGAENAVSRRDLMALTGLSDRELRLMIQQERLEGVPICANNLTGYYIAADDEERKRFVKSMRHRAGEILKSAAAIEQAE